MKKKGKNEKEEKENHAPTWVKREKKEANREKMEKKMEKNKKKEKKRAPTCMRGVFAFLSLLVYGREAMYIIRESHRRDGCAHDTINGFIYHSI